MTKILLSKLYLLLNDFKGDHDVICNSNAAELINNSTLQTNLSQGYYLKPSAAQQRTKKSSPMNGKIQ